MGKDDLAYQYIKEKAANKRVSTTVRQQGGSTSVILLSSQQMLSYDLLSKSPAAATTWLPVHDYGNTHRRKLQ